MQKMNGKMLKNCLHKALWAVLFLIALTAPAVWGEEDGPALEELLDKIEAAYAQKSFTADFEQTSTLKALDVKEKASGNACFSHPGKMRWQYTGPRPHQIITNGKVLWIYQPADNQVVKGSADNFFKTGAGGAFLSDIAAVRENYRIHIIGRDRKTIRLKLDPRQKTPHVSAITIFVSKEPSRIKKVVTENIYEDTTTIAFSNITFQKIDDAVFEFEIPEKCDVIYMNK